MLKGKLTLSGGMHGPLSTGCDDKFDYNGIIRRKLEFVVTGNTQEEIVAKLRRELPDVKGIASKGTSDTYKAAVAGLPMLAASKLNEKGFGFVLNFDNYDDLVASASWEIGPNPDLETIILQ